MGVSRSIFSFMCNATRHMDKVLAKHTQKLCDVVIDSEEICGIWE